MPTIHRLDNNAVIRMYFHDHAPPHVHVHDGGDEGLIEIRTQRLYAGFVRKNVFDDACGWVNANEAALLVQWADFGGG